jgi:hypothetical protein
MLNIPESGVAAAIHDLKRLAPAFLSKEHDEIHPLLLLPPIRHCLAGCLYMPTGSRSNCPVELHHLSNDPAKANLFDIDGRQRVLNRPNLICFKCGSIYHYDMWLNSTDKKYRFYQDERPIFCVTQKTFFTRRLCEFMTENM